MCGRLLFTLSDPYGQASSAAANDAINGTIVVGHIQNVSSPVAACKMMICMSLPSPNMSSLAGVAMDKDGSCYADAYDASGHVGLWVYTSCAGTGTELSSANGFNEPAYGGLSVDNHGNLVVVSFSYFPPSTVTVYSGCITSVCKIIGGPLNLNGQSVFAHLGRENERLVTVNWSTSMVEVYAYIGHGTDLRYLYSFNNGLTCATNLCESAAYSPGSPKL